MIPIKNFLDYRKYLLEFYETKRKESKFFSYRYMANRLGVDHAYVLRVLGQKSHLANRHIGQFSLLCGLSGSDAEYFRTLVRFNKSKDKEEAATLLEKLVSISGVKSFPINVEQCLVFNEWYHLPIRAILGSMNFKGDYAGLASSLSPRITEAQAKESVRLLEDVGLIRNNADGGYSLAHSLISSGADSKPESVRKFQKEMMQLAQDSLDRFPKEERDVSTVTIAIKYDDLENLKEKIFAFRQSVMNMAEQANDTDVVFQINIALFPLSQIPIGG